MPSRCTRTAAQPVPSSRSASASSSRVGPSATITPVVEDDRARAQLQGVRQVVGDHQQRDVQRPQDVGELAAARPGRGWTTARRAPGSPGCIASTVATATRRRCPKDRWCGARSANAAMPTARERLVDPLGPARRRAGRGWPGRRRRPRATVGMNSWSSGSWKTMPTRRRISAQVGRLGRPAGRRPRPRPPPAARMPLRCSTSVVLPAPLGPSRATRSPACDGEVDAEQRLVPVGVGEVQAASPAGIGVTRVTLPSRSTSAATTGTAAAAAHCPAVALGLASAGIGPS